MTRTDAIDYLAGTNDIAVRAMDKATFRFLRSASRRAGSLAGYYDPEFDGVRADPTRVRFAPAIWGDTVPMTRELRAAIVSRIADPMADPFNFFA
jgi:hypothetical protein